MDIECLGYTIEQGGSIGGYSSRHITASTDLEVLKLIEETYQIPIGHEFGARDF